MLQRDKRRWARADVDGDGELSKEEFASFLHPEETDHMKEIIIDVRFSCDCNYTYCNNNNTCTFCVVGERLAQSGSWRKTGKVVFK